jgi:hypothetical protein
MSVSSELRLVGFVMLGLVWGVVGCASEDLSEGETEAAFLSSRQVAGFDFEGFQSGPAGGGEACGEVVDQVAQQCHEAGGEVREMKGCRTLCSLPVAPHGSVAGFDFDGFQSGPRGGGEPCLEIVDLVAERCHAASGETTAMKGCRTLCSVPVAPLGMVAGYLFSGPVVRAAQGGGICDLLTTPELVACNTAGGQTIMTEGCETLCSVPIAR